MVKKLNVAIIGTGNIGIDLLVKVLKTQTLYCVLIAGRRSESAGMCFAKDKGVNTSDQGINAVIDNIDNIDIVMDCSSASAHRMHWELLKKTHVKVIDLTPSNIGIPIIPSVNIKDVESEKNISLVTCGGQGAIPIAKALTDAIPEINYIEVVNTIASKSAGPATRSNLDEYILTTANVVSQMTNVESSKSIILLNPATPCINMKTSIFAMVDRTFSDSNVETAKQAVNKAVAGVVKYVPGYKILLEPNCDKNKLVVTIEVTGKGDYLPSYAGNLDIITCAAIEVAEHFSQVKESLINE